MNGLQWTDGRMRFGPPTAAMLRRLSTRSRRHGSSLIDALRAELNHEHSSGHPPRFPSLPRLGFEMEFDAPRCPYIVLRRPSDGECEEIVVSAMLAPMRFRLGEPLPRDARMKICAAKEGIDGVLRFECRIPGTEHEGGGSHFDVVGMCYHSRGGKQEDEYLGPEFRSLDPKLRAALKSFLLTRNINEDLAGFVHRHLCVKEQFQYVQWLQRLMSLASPED